MLPEKKGKARAKSLSTYRRSFASSGTGWATDARSAPRAGASRSTGLSGLSLYDTAENEDNSQLLNIKYVVQSTHAHKHRKPQHRQVADTSSRSLEAYAVCTELRLTLEKTASIFKLIISLNLERADSYRQNAFSKI